MPQPSLMYVLSHILQNIPYQLLDLAFKPRQFNTTVEQRIISQVIEGPALLEINLVGGKPRVITMNSAWLMDLRHSQAYGITGPGMEASFYLIPPEAREHRNISSVLGVTAIAGGAIYGGNVIMNGQTGGNTAMNLISEMVGTHTGSSFQHMPQISLHGTNILRFYPELMTDGLSVRVMLEHDSEFADMNVSAIYALRNFCLCAVQRYIVTNLIVPVDETEIVAGMEIGVIKTLIMEYKQEMEKYDSLLIKLKGAMHFDPNAINRIMYHSL